MDCHAFNDVRVAAAFKTRRVNDIKRCTVDGGTSWARPSAVAPTGDAANRLTYSISVGPWRSSDEARGATVARKAASGAARSAREERSMARDGTRGRRTGSAAVE